MKRIISILLASLILSSCAEIAMDRNLYEYKNIQNQLNLGDSKSKILGKLEPLMTDLPSSWKRPSDQYMVDQDIFYIYYHRTSWTQDGAVTDDEFTPYVFKNDKLVAIGWQSLGGPKTVGNASAASANQRAQSEALIKMGQDMMKTPTPKTTTSTCRVTGTGAFKTVTCY